MLIKSVMWLGINKLGRNIRKEKKSFEKKKKALTLNEKVMFEKKKS